MTWCIFAGFLIMAASVWFINSTEDQNKINLGCVGFAIGMLLLVFSLFASGAQAHDHNRPDLNEWFKGLESRSKSPCCDGDDALAVEDPDWEMNSGHYRVRLSGEWVDVPDRAVVDGPNRDGRAMVWPYYVNGELRGVRCFLPGSMT